MNHPETCAFPCGDCIKGRHFNCNGSVDASNADCDCPCDPGDDEDWMRTRDLTLEYDTGRETWLVIEGGADV